MIRDERSAHMYSMRMRTDIIGTVKME